MCLLLPGTGVGTWPGPVCLHRVMTACLWRLAAFPNLPALDLIGACCEEVDELNGPEACGHNLWQHALHPGLHQTDEEMGSHQAFLGELHHGSLMRRSCMDCGDTVVQQAVAESGRQVADSMTGRPTMGSRSAGTCLCNLLTTKLRSQRMIA